jgi:2-dehydro-3-deoxyphosphogluconate aldolase / (4S)-4-hydroxy-2-oxoglutarate aldolase
MMPEILNPTANRVATEQLPGTASREEVCRRVRETGVIPVLRGASPEAALFVAESLAQGGIPIIEIAANRPGALAVISHLVKYAPEIVVGAGSVTDMATARRCLDIGVKFLASDAQMLDMCKFRAAEKVAVLPGAFTPSEILAAWDAGVDFVRVVPCNAAGGASYIRSVKAALPDVPLIAAGGVTQMTALGLASAGATALAVGGELIPEEAIRLRQGRRIQELARRFLGFVDNGRIESAGRNDFLAELK